MKIIFYPKINPIIDLGPTPTPNLGQDPDDRFKI